MIENSYVIVKSDGRRVEVNYFEDEKLREGPAMFPARYASFAAIIQYVETQFNGRRLTLSERAKIQELLGSPWPYRKLLFQWADARVDAVPA